MVINVAKMYSQVANLRKVSLPLLLQPEKYLRSIRSELSFAIIL